MSPRFDNEPALGFPLPSEIVQSVKARDEMEERQLRIRALAQTLAEPEHIIAHREMTTKMRAEKGIREPRPRQYVPGQLGPGPMNTINPSGTGLAGSGMATPMPNQGNAELAMSPRWIRSVELMVNKLGFNAPKLEQRAEAVRIYTNGA